MKHSTKDEYYKFIFENSLDAIMLTCPDGKIYKANPAACEMFQMTEVEIVGAGRAGLVDTDDPRLEKALKERQDKGRVRTELTFIRKDGNTFEGDLTSAIFTDSNNKQWTAMIIRDITDIKKAETSLKKLQQETEYFATYDYLTDTLNRRSFISSLQKEIDRSNRQKLPMVQMLIDIDKFKDINDIYGHVGGDLVLKEVAKNLKTGLRMYDYLGRYGGDEFIIFLPNTIMKTGMEIAERLRKNIEDMIIEYDNQKIKTTISLGASFYDYKNPEDIDVIISKLDKYMYRAKSKRNHVYTIN